MKQMKQIIDSRLSHMTVQGREDDLLRAIRARANPSRAARRARRPALLAAALLIVLAAATAVAVGLNLSQDYMSLRAAKQAVIQQYGLSARSIEMFAAKETHTGAERAFTFTPHMQIEAMGVYTVTFRNGQAVATWSHDGTDPSVYADGSLESSVWGPKQIEAYMDLREEEYRASMAAPAETPSLPASEPAVFVGARMDTLAAVEAADQALRAQRGFSESSLELFHTNARYDGATGLWTAVYSGNLDYVWQELYEGRLGEYTVTLSDTDGSVQSITWSLDGVDNNVYTRETWGQAKAYGGETLNWAAELWHARKAILSKYDEGGEWPVSVEDNAACDALMLAAGFPAQPHYNHVLPEPGDLTLEQAQELFFQAVNTEFGVTREVFDASVYAYTDLTQQDGYREWYFWLQSNSELCSWSVTLNAQTGEILMLYVDPAAASNG